MAVSDLTSEVDRLVDTHGIASVIEQLVARLGIDAVRAEVKRYKMGPRRRRARTEQELFEVWLAIELERAKGRSRNGRDPENVCRRMKRFTWISARGGQYSIARVIESPEALMRIYKQAGNFLRTHRTERRAWEGYRDAVVQQQREARRGRRAR
ncbi:MAG TPA: hypothetical protein VMB81_18925 [Candidatus Sulfotelmatobacter sp.]|nr:hypothetical protein [Candidatus Sulfotelmatobacter sp.]